MQIFPCAIQSKFSVVKSAPPSDRVTTRGEKIYGAIVQKRAEIDQKMRRMHDDFEEVIEDGDVDIMMPPKKVIPSVLRQQVTKADHVPCEECKREKARGDALGFHFCPNDEVVGFRTKAGPIARPSASTSCSDPGAAERTG